MKKWLSGLLAIVLIMGVCASAVAAQDEPVEERMKPTELYAMDINAEVTLVDWVIKIAGTMTGIASVVTLSLLTKKQ